MPKIVLPPRRIFLSSIRHSELKGSNVSAFIALIINSYLHDNWDEKIVNLLIKTHVNVEMLTLYDKKINYRMGHHLKGWSHHCDEGGRQFFIIFLFTIRHARETTLLTTTIGSEYKNLIEEHYLRHNSYHYE